MAPSATSLTRPSFSVFSRHAAAIPSRRIRIPSISSCAISRQIPPLISPASSPSPLSPRRRRGGSRAAYVTAPAWDPDSDEKGRSSDESPSPPPAVRPAAALSWGVIWPLLARHKARIAVSLVSLVCGTSCTLAMPIFSGKFFEILIGRRSEPLSTLLSKIAVLYSLEPIFTVLFVTNMTIIWEKVMASIRSLLFRRMLIQKVEFFDRYKVGELTGLLTSDLGSLKDLVSENISRDRGFRALSEIIGTICILFSLSTQLAPLLGLLILSVSVVVAIYKRSTVPVFKSHGAAQASISDCASETFSAIRTVRSFAGEERQISLFGNLVLAYQKSGIKLGALKAANESLTRIVVYISLLALYCLGGSKVKAGELSFGTMASFIGYTFTLTFAVQGGVNTLGDLRGTLAAVERINSVLAATEIDDSLAYSLEKEVKSDELRDANLGLLYKDGYSEKNHAPSSHYMSSLRSVTDGCSLAWSGDICLEDVYFSYPMRSDVEVLNGLNLTLACGKVTALVGPSGSGKSTIVQLLARFYEPSRGRITVAGEDIRTFDKREWARAVSLVNQVKIHHLLLKSKFRTLQKEEADLFFVPSYVKCVRMKGGLSDKEINQTFVQVLSQMPYFRLSGGRDHVFVFPSGAGAHLFRSWATYLNRSIILTPEGDRTDKRDTSAFNTWKDIIIPGNVDDGMTKFYGSTIVQPIPLPKRKYLANFLGRAQGKVGRIQSLELAKQYPEKLECPDLKFTGPDKLGRVDYFNHLRNAKFCLSPRGESSWTLRFYESFFVECIPVILSDQIELPFQNVIDYSQISIKWPSTRTGIQLLEYLESIPDEVIEEMIARGRKVRCLWAYASETELCSAYLGILWELQRKVRRFHQSAETFWLHNGSIVNRDLVEFNNWRTPLPLP